MYCSKLTDVVVGYWVGTEGRVLMGQNCVETCELCFNLRILISRGIKTVKYVIPD